MLNFEPIPNNVSWNSHNMFGLSAWFQKSTPSFKTKYIIFNIYPHF